MEVVGLGVGFYRPHHRHLGIPQGKSVAGGGDGDLQPLLVGIVDEFIEDFGGIGAGGGVNRFGRVHRQHRGQTAHMILMGVGAHHRRQLLDTLLLEIRHHQLAVLPVAPVNEHEFAPAFQQGAVRLAYIKKRNGQALPGCLNRSRKRLGAAAQQYRQGEYQGKELGFQIHVICPSCKGSSE